MPGWIRYLACCRGDDKMDYRYHAVDKLKRYLELKTAIDNTKLRIMELQMKREEIESPKPSETPITHSAENKVEEKLISLIASEEEEKNTLRRTIHEVQQIDKSLKNLNEEEKLVLEKFFICRPRNHVQQLMQELSCEKSEVYRTKDRGLERFTRSLYGIVHK